MNAVDKAKEACINAEQKLTDHFADVSKMVQIGSGAEKEIDDILLTRYACYPMNAVRKDLRVCPR